MLRKNKWMGPTVGALLLTMAALLPTTARADHDSFENQGPACNNPFLVDALSSLQQASNPYAAQHFAGRAKYDVEKALETACNSQAQFYLNGAHDHLDTFLWRRDVCDLNDAARLISKAVAASQAGAACAPTYNGGGPVYGSGNVAPALPSTSYYPAPVPAAPAYGYGYGSRPQAAFTWAAGTVGCS